ncbi:myomodulin neuropeptides 1-like [Haliotis cracherodii]|uniref:myomodulin neuropeptides 1-like n=1 Tax=Haliotis cracherodii TaxID=6455 RepID=UPI0039ED2CF8
MNAALFAKAVTVLLLVICKQGYSEEQTQSEGQDEPASREKRGLNMLRLGRGLQMLRLGKRGGLNMLRLGRSSPSSEELSDYLYDILQNEYLVNPEVLNGEDDIMYPDSSRYRRSAEGDRAVALPRIGKDEEEEYADEYEKRALSMLRLGRSGEGMEDEVVGLEPEDEEEKRALGMLRLGKRPMNMLRLGKRPMNMLRLGKRPMNMLRLGKRPMNMLRLGKRPMNMLRLGKRPMNMLRLGKRPMNMLRLGKRPMNMLRLGKREDETEGEEKRALGMLRLGKRSDEKVDGDAGVSTQQ